MLLLWLHTHFAYLLKIPFGTCSLLLTVMIWCVPLVRLMVYIRVSSSDIVCDLTDLRRFQGMVYALFRGSIINRPVFKAWDEPQNCLFSSGCCTNDRLWLVPFENADIDNIKIKYSYNCIPPPHPPSPRGNLFTDICYMWHVKWPNLVSQIHATSDMSYDVSCLYR